MADTVMNGTDLEEEDEEPIRASHSNRLSPQETNRQIAKPMFTDESDDDDDEISLPEKNSQPPEDFCFSEIVTILVGEEKAVCLVHKDVLPSTSPFFKKCLASVWRREGQENIIEMPEETCEFFRSLTVWMYRGTVRSIWNDDSLDQAITTWASAEQFFVPEWQKALVDAIVSYWQDNRVEPRYVGRVLRDFHQDWQISKLVIDLFAYCLANNPTWYWNYRANEITSLDGLLERLQWIKFTARGNRRNPCHHVRDYYKPIQ